MKNNTKNLEAVKNAETIAALAANDLEDAVVRAVLDGASWQEIGDALGVSKQTAHNRYSKQADFAARCEAGETSMSREDSEKQLSSIYNPEPRVVIGMKRDYSYRRTLRQ